jgi:NADH-quinone oxidoreductase subunit N
MPEVLLMVAALILIVGALVKSLPSLLFHGFTLFIFSASFILVLFSWPDEPVNLFAGMLRTDGFSAYLKLLIDLSGIFTALMTWRNTKIRHLPEYYALIITVGLGAHLLVMSTNLVMVFISLELISISSYVLTAFSFSPVGAEGSQKYFLFGSVASAVMLYGLTFLYGLSGTFDFTSEHFAKGLLDNQSVLFVVAGSMALAGFLYKMAAAPLHPWAPDVYEAAPMPVVAFFSVVPKLAGVGIFVRFILALNLYGQSTVNWQYIVCIVAMLSLTVGNFSALWQKRPKRLMAYSSIAQSGFLLVGIAAFIPSGIGFMLFYATIYMLITFLVFIYLQYFESVEIRTIESFAGIGKSFIWPSLGLLVGFVALTGLPPTAGFTAKLLVFSSVWESYQLSKQPVLLWLLVFGLLNTVIALFYYLRIPFYAFIKSTGIPLEKGNQTFENVFGGCLVILVILLFFNPDLLMGWINKINFVF